ncbi:KEOPS complex subunit Cgi121 [Halorubrum ezzemoulense]|uniref:KEOPS complex subunit Cgi121 n=1 Tax=Halorubrum ezzemoulense TaxID=337243 RepID=A0ABT4Z1W8_HALEZ|nr:KEOPS complex subunit Cgi121 [Halorubrum ezzemoulense]MDB2244291.1 KEOPS complex subunit Cgi121 [Halorubrum ezzemoulense]MDB2252263.1 KEOPS complex subunit Cgi121 [Halorubrum ezzemoulense]MDB2278026.1 KEOPS complex subunit Cgi121 [Halorubrum ezzemoulense]MDB2289653.1 KEOPS complex subunit Cgi121 [Halorubrum ezzemoulense]MDB2292138.1 KEOPS complex subunit Cgi121 [Halorubrum ezzemoulense]
MTDSAAGGDGMPAPDPGVSLVAGTFAIDDLDAFLADLDAIAADTGAVVQAFDADLVVSPTHLREAARLAARAIARGEAVARDPGVEVLLYAAGRRQIDRALELGVSEGERAAVVLVADFGDVSGADRPSADLDQATESVRELTADSRTDPDDSGLPVDFDEERVREFYGVTDRELTATTGGLADVVRERVALLDVEK